MPSDKPSESKAVELSTDTPVSADSERDAPSTPYAVTATTQPLAIPGYELHEPIGRGGMGVVYKAKHVKLNREVAIKLLPNAALAGETALARFLAEAQVVAAIRHPNVIDVYDFGEVYQVPYLVMELLDSQHFGRRFPTGTPHDPRAVAAVMAKVCRGVAAAHAKDIVHRDLKPANVLFAATGEPKVVDFGLAKRAVSDLTQSVATMGTPYYMAPEQAKGKSKAVGPQADVWSLGVILYECLTGRRPFTAEDQMSILLSIVSEEPEPPRAVNPAVPPELERLVLKCLRKNPEDRYPNAAALAEELEGAQETINFVPLTQAEPHKRKTSSTWVGIVVLLVALVGTAATLFILNKVEPDDRRTVLLEKSHDPEPDEPDAALPEPKIPKSNPFQEMGKKKREEALDQTNTAVLPRPFEPKTPVFDKQIDPKNAANPEMNAAATPRAWKNVLTLTGHTDGVTWAGFNHDGSRIVTASYDRTAKVWDTKTGAVAVELKAFLEAVLTAVFDRDGTHVLTACNSTQATFLDVKSGQVVRTVLPGSGIVTSAAFDTSGSRFVTTGSDGRAKVWETSGRVDALTLLAHDQMVTAGSFSPDGAFLATSSTDETVKVWDLKTAKAVLTIKDFNSSVLSVAFNHDGTRLVTACTDKTAAVWDAKTGANLRTLKGHTNVVYSAVFSPDGALIVTASGDETAKVWDAKTGDLLHTLTGHTSSVNSAAFNKDGTRIVTASTDHTAKVWELVDQK